MIIIAVRVPKKYIDAIDQLVRKGLVTSRSEAIRIALRDYIQREVPNFSED
jgi:Ribbon-helix-helix protein, copG family.